MKKKFEALIISAYEKHHLKTNNRLRLPTDGETGINVRKEGNLITLILGEHATKQNMQTDSNAFESWILALVALGQNEAYFNCDYTVSFHSMVEPKDKNARLEWQNYQRLLFRIKKFDELFGNKWFRLSKATKLILDDNCEYYKATQLLANTGSGDRSKIPKEISSLTISQLLSKTKSKPIPAISESKLECILCKDGKHGQCIQEVFNTDTIFRQFPIGIFKDRVTKKVNEDDTFSSIFPSGKACIDLVADGKDDNSFWIFELKTSGNTSLGIISELLYYVAIVRDMVADKIKAKDPKDKHCYKPSWLENKSVINACFLAPNFHPLFSDRIIHILNEAFKSSHSSEKVCSVVFHKANLVIGNENISIDKSSVCPQKLS